MELVKEDNHLEDIQLIFNSNIKHIPKNGIIHVGAHKGEEVSEYIQQGFKNIILIEANPDLYGDLKEKYKNHDNVKVYGNAISNTNTTSKFYIHKSRRGSIEPSSLLQLKEFKNIVSTLDTVEVIDVETVTLDNLFKKENLNFKDYNFMNIDIQGAELYALQGAEELLKYIDVLIAEVALIELYQDQPLESDIVKYLSGFEFVKNRTIYHPLYDESGEFPAWGESIFIKQKYNLD